MALISIRYPHQLVIPDLNIAVDYQISHEKEFISELGVLIGGIVGILLGLFVPSNPEFIYLLFSFVCGAILYPIVKDIIPHQEEGKPLYFLLGATIFSILILIIRSIEHNVVHL